MALRDSRIENFNELWPLVASGGLEFCVSSTSFQKSNIGWPQQPPTERVSNFSKNWIFDEPFQTNGLVLVIWVLGMNQPSGSAIFLVK